MRVIAGTAGGIQLVVPGSGVRPTMDRVKGAIFSSLGEAVVGARVLDLFAGSGALGIEALSRGAVTAVFVEQDRQAIAAIEKNLAKTRLKGSVRQANVFAFLRRAASNEKFQIIFTDPPYEKTKSGERFTEKLLSDEALPQLLEPNGIFVLEKRPNETLPETRRWRVIRQKIYGATEVLFLHLLESNQDNRGGDSISPPQN
jgi:16S rRNA (guanine966-N2)-methyltransferase